MKHSAPGAKGSHVQNIELREFIDSDFDALASIVGQAWHRAPDPRDERLGGAVDLATCLQRTTYTQVSLAGGTPVGFMFARAGACDPATDKRWAAVRLQNLQKLRQHNPQLGADLEEYTRIEQRIDAGLLQAFDRDLDGEYTLFLLAPEARGLGLGRTLFENARAWLAAQGARRAYLFTDESCTWGIYEHFGLHRAAEYRSTPEEARLMLPAYYLYVDELGR